jgi:hypothetical protein
MPGIFDLPDVRFDYELGLPELGRRQADVDRQVNRGLQPELGFAIGVRDMDVNARFFSRKEEQAERTVANNCG